MIRARIKGHNEWRNCGTDDPTDAAIHCASYADSDDVTVEVIRQHAAEIKVYEVQRRTAYKVTELPSVSA
jgi:hypothetical protein